MKIKFHYSLLVLLIILAFTGLYLEILILFMIIFLHELSHVMFLIIFKQKIKYINLTILGGILYTDNLNLKIYQEIIVNLAGVLLNYLLIVIFKKIENNYYKELIINYNYIMIVFNLLPIYPLDGYRLIETLIKLINHPFKEQKILTKISNLFWLFGFIISFYKYKSFALLIIFIYLGYQNFKLYINRTQISLKKYIKTYNYNT